MKTLITFLVAFVFGIYVAFSTHLIADSGDTIVAVLVAFALFLAVLVVAALFLYPLIGRRLKRQFNLEDADFKDILTYWKDSPENFRADVWPRIVNASPAIFVWWSRVGLGAALVGLLSATALLASVIVGWQQVQRLTQQNAIIERQLPLLLRQSIASYENEIRVLSAQADRSKEALSELLDLAQREGSLDTRFPRDICRYDTGFGPSRIKEVSDCEIYRELTMKEISGNQEKMRDFQAFYRDWLTFNFHKLDVRWGSRVIPDRYESDDQYYRRSGLFDIARSCGLTEPSGAEFMRSIEKFRRMESVNRQRSSPFAEDQIRYFERIVPLSETVLVQDSPRLINAGYRELRQLIEQALEQCQRNAKDQSAAIVKLRTALDADRDELARISFSKSPFHP